ncbi:MAG: fasciclin domain-containing protein [Longimicrobiales bacterium]|nr:fasciclin domain-containing protein [Longimicrobiales bacterium]
MRKIGMTVALMAGLLVPGQVLAQGYGEKSGKTIVDVAMEAGSFETLVTAVKEAGLVEVLSSEGPFTVFAPTDEAFAALPEGTLEALLADREALKAVLTYHVIPGKVMARDVLAAERVRPETVQGAALDVRVMNEGVMVNDARVVQTDIEASNGVIHVIDSVVLPPSMRSSAESY